MSEYRTIRLDLAEGVATLTLARPDKMNALSTTLLTEVAAAVDAAIAAGARALVITGEGRAFSSGADLAGENGEIGLPEDLGALLDSYYHPLVETLAALPIPIVTAINGPCAGAGVSLALAGDIVLAARSSYLLLAFVNIGLVPDAGATWLVAKAVGRTKALEMALLGEKLPAEKALEAGLVTRVVEDGELLDEAHAIARRFATMPTRAIAMIRAQVKAALAGTFEETLAIERDHQRLAGRSADFKEGVTAFLEKRSPRFEGK